MFDSDMYTEELLSEFDTESAAALRLMEENVFDDICESENYQEDFSNDLRSDSCPSPIPSAAPGSYETRKLMNRIALASQSNVINLISMEVVDSKFKNHLNRISLNLQDPVQTRVYSR